MLRMDPATVGTARGTAGRGAWGRALFAAQSARLCADGSGRAVCADHAVQAEAALDAALEEGQGEAGLTERCEAKTIWKLCRD